MIVKEKFFLIVRLRAVMQYLDIYGYRWGSPECTGCAKEAQTFGKSFYSGFMIDLNESILVAGRKAEVLFHLLSLRKFIGWQIVEKGL